MLVSSSGLAAGASVTVNLYFYNPSITLLPKYGRTVVAGGTP
ncbi:MAG TPA: hypothetical protein VKA46_05400 [Gemmataceae bacterium]|nr:hypothetical protein [Gemmataceae bacterium]